MVSPPESGFARSMHHCKSMEAQETRALMTARRLVQSNPRFRGGCAASGSRSEGRRRRSSRRESGNSWPGIRLCRRSPSCCCPRLRVAYAGVRRQEASRNDGLKHLFLRLSLTRMIQKSRRLFGQDHAHRLPRQPIPDTEVGSISTVRRTSPGWRLGYLSCPRYFFVNRSIWSSAPASATRATRPRICT
jgi:hypothetical protein